MPIHRSESEALRQQAHQTTIDHQWTEVAAADDDMIGGAVLEWSGSEAIWDEHELGDDYNVISDVLDACPSADVDKDTWDAGFPGRSGFWYVVSTAAPEKLKAEVRSRIEELVRERGE